MELVHFLINVLFLILLNRDSAKINNKHLNVERSTPEEISNAHNVNTMVIKDCSLDDLKFIDDITRFENLTILELQNVDGNVQRLVDKRSEKIVENINHQKHI